MESSPLPPMQGGRLAVLWEDAWAWVLEMLPAENRVQHGRGAEKEEEGKGNGREKRERNRDNSGEEGWKGEEGGVGQVDGGVGKDGGIDGENCGWGGKFGGGTGEVDCGAEVDGVRIGGVDMGDGGETEDGEG